MEITVPFSSYKFLRFFAIVAGLLGLAQSLAWMGLSITAIVAYGCNIDFTESPPNYGTLLRRTIFHMYFRADDCVPVGWGSVDFTAIQGLNLMTSATVNIWMWVVASLSLLWLFSSVTLITNVKKSNLRYLNIFIYFWIVITFAISMIDLVLFIFFIIDYDTIMKRSYENSLNFVPETLSILITAQNTAGMMASLSLRGYLLWFINLTLTVFLFTQTFKVYDYNKLKSVGHKPSGQVNSAFKNDELQGHSIFQNEPINAFETQAHTMNLPWYNYLTTDIPRVQRPQSIYPPPLMRSKSATNLDESFQRRMTAAGAEPSTLNTFKNEPVILRREQVQRELKNRQSVNNGLANYSQTPQPYIQTPQPYTQSQNYEARPQLKSAMRNSRYQ